MSENFTKTAELEKVMSDNFLSWIKYDVTKLSAKADEYIKRRVREGSILNKIIPPEVATKADFERTDDGKTLVLRKSIKSDTYGITVGPRGMGLSAPIRAKLFAMPLTKYVTDTYTYTQDDFLTHTIDIIKILEEDLLKDLLDLVDAHFFEVVEACLAYTASIGESHTETITLPLTQRKFLDGVEKLVDPKGVSYPNPRVLMTDKTLNHIKALDANAVGSELAAKNMLGLEKYESVLGIERIPTVKSYIVPDNVCYFFAENTKPAVTLGWNYDFNDVHFTVKNEHDDYFEFKATFHKAFGIGNAHAVAKLIMVTP